MSNNKPFEQLRTLCEGLPDLSELVAYTESLDSEGYESNAIEIMLLAKQLGEFVDDLKKSVIAEIARKEVVSFGRQGKEVLGFVVTAEERTTKSYDHLPEYVKAKENFKNFEKSLTPHEKTSFFLKFAKPKK